MVTINTSKHHHRGYEKRGMEYGWTYQCQKSPPSAPAHGHSDDSNWLDLVTRDRTGEVWRRLWRICVGWWLAVVVVLSCNCYTPWLLLLSVEMTALKAGTRKCATCSRTREEGEMMMLMLCLLIHASCFHCSPIITRFNIIIIPVIIDPTPYRGITTIQ